MHRPETDRPAWREPMLWLVVGIPMATVIAGISTVIIATGGGGMERASGVQVTAQIQVEKTDTGTASARR